MIDGITTYGSTDLIEKLQENRDNAVFLLTIGTTETSEIEGISGAGASAELTAYTPAADVEFEPLKNNVAELLPPSIGLLVEETVIVIPVILNPNSGTWM